MDRSPVGTGDIIEPKRLTIEEFDAWVQTAAEEFTNELHAGIVYAFATGSQNHGDLCSAPARFVLPTVALPCRAYLGSISVRREPERPSSVVPELAVTCEEREATNIFVREPKLGAQVISPSCVPNELVRKIVSTAIPSIKEYLVVDSRSMWAHVFRRDTDGQLWAAGRDDLVSPEDIVELRTLSIPFALEALYTGII